MNKLERRRIQKAYLQTPRGKESNCEKTKRYYWANREKILARQREHPNYKERALRYYREHKEEYKKKRALKREEFRAYQRDYYRKNRDRILAREQKRHNRLGSGICAICGLYTKFLCKDHCHKTGKMRSGLCAPCNLMLGNARDNVMTLQNAIRYLESWKEQHGDA